MNISTSELQPPACILRHNSQSESVPTYLKATGSDIDVPLAFSIFRTTASL